MLSVYVFSILMCDTQRACPGHLLHASFIFIFCNCSLYVRGGESVTVLSGRHNHSFFITSLQPCWWLPSKCRFRCFPFTPNVKASERPNIIIIISGRGRGLRHVLLFMNLLNFVDKWRIVRVFDCRWWLPTSSLIKMLSHYYLKKHFYFSSRLSTIRAGPSHTLYAFSWSGLTYNMKPSATNALTMICDEMNGHILYRFSAYHNNKLHLCFSFFIHIILKLYSVFFIHLI